jgi:spore coat protein CotH
VRLTSPQKGTPDVKRPKSKKEPLVERATRARYDEIGFVAAICNTSGEGCYAALDKLVDVDQYLRWLALMTLVKSGDYVDEVGLCSC